MWAELADGSCRWRQTGSEVKVICLKVRLTPMPPFSAQGQVISPMQPQHVWALRMTYNSVIAEALSHEVREV